MLAKANPGWNLKGENPDLYVPKIHAMSGILGASQAFTATSREAGAGPPDVALSFLDASWSVNQRGDCGWVGGWFW